MTHVMIDRKNVFDQPVRYDMRTLEDIRKIITGQNDDSKTSCLLLYPYFKEKYYMLIAIDLSKGV